MKEALKQLNGAGTQTRAAEVASQIFGSPVSIALVRKVVQAGNGGQKRGRGRPKKVQAGDTPVGAVIQKALAAPKPVPHPNAQAQPKIAITRADGPVSAEFVTKDKATKARKQYLIDFIRDAMTPALTIDEFVDVVHAVEELQEIFLAEVDAEDDDEAIE